MISSTQNNRFIGTLFIAAIISMLFVNSCRTAHRVPDQPNIKVSQPWVFSFDFQKAVYKTQMLVYGNELTGLTMIKETGSTYRVVFMSEIGLKYFDLEFSMLGDSVQTHYVINLLDRKQVLGMIETNYNLLFMRFPERRSEKFFNDGRTKGMIKEIKYKGQKSRYTYDGNFGMVKTIFNKKRGRNLSINVNIKDHLAPQTINCNQTNFSLRLERLD